MAIFKSKDELLYKGEIFYSSFTTTKFIKKHCICLFTA